MSLIPALLTVLCFASSAIASRRSTLLVSSLWANFIRLSLACLLLGLGVLVISPSLPPWNLSGLYFFSGMIGFGFGDIALFLAYARLGSRLTFLVMICFAPIFGAAGDWLLIGNTVGPWQAVAIFAILFGVVLAVSGRFSHTLRATELPLGVFLALLAGLGQALGTVVSRKANEVAALMGQPVPAVTQAFERCSGGWMVAGSGMLCLVLVGRHLPFWRSTEKNRWRQSALWITAAALCGPVVGVSCYQWAIQVLDNSALVLGLTALTPIALIPMAWVLDNDKPTARSVAGAIIAVSGVAAIALLQKP